MKRLTSHVLRLTISILLTFSLSGIAAAKEDVGTVVAIRNKAIIEREKREIPAKVKDGILFIDTVSTLEVSRAKMLFIDDSVLTMGEKSRMVIKEFLYKDGKGKSIFNLLDGKMRSVVGKTEFEVLTPTAVAAARGTVILFEVGVRDGKRFTTIICLEGEVSVKSADPSIAGIVTLKPGMMVTVFEKEPLPAQSVAPAEEVERLKRDTEIGTYEISIPAPMVIAPEHAVIELVPSIPPVEQQPIPTTPVRIDLTFPQ